MKIKELITELEKHNPEQRVLISVESHPYIAEISALYTRDIINLITEEPFSRQDWSEEEVLIIEGKEE